MRKKIGTANAFQVLRKRQTDEFLAFPQFYAMGEASLQATLERMGLGEDQVCRIFDGVYIVAKDYPAFQAMQERHRSELQAAIAADRTGGNFIFEMFLVQLQNHEYGYTEDASDALDSLGLTWEQVNANVRLKRGLDMAMARVKRNTIPWL